MVQYTVTGMSCAACSARVEKAVSGVEGVTSCSVSLLTNSMGVEGTAAPEAIIRAVENAGYGAKLKEDTSETSGSKGSGAAKGMSEKLRAEEEALKDTATPVLKKRLFASVPLLLILMYFSMGHMMWHWPAPSAFDDHVFLGLFELLITVVIMIINGRFFISGFKSLTHGAPNMDTLVALGSGTAFVYSTAELFMMTLAMGRGDEAVVEKLGMNLYFESAAMILTLITVGKLLEAISKGRTTDALKSLIRMSPREATLIADGVEKQVSIDEVKVGDILAVRPGESIPVDGFIEEGSTAVNESALTGESIPVDKDPGDTVSSGSVNQTGFIRMRATRVGEDTTLSQIIKLVSDAAATKAPLARIADKVSGVFVPAVIGIALLTLIGWMIAGRPFSFAIARAISVLVISCPCALGLATPVAIMVGSGVGARNGILYKTAASLETLGRTGTIVFDKTGTVTKGEPEVTELVPAEGVTERELMENAAGLEAKSEHPLSKAIIRKAGTMNVTSASVTDFRAVPGNGLSAVAADGRFSGMQLFGGSISYISGLVPVAESLKQKAEVFAAGGKTPMLFAALPSGVAGAQCAADSGDAADAPGDGAVLLGLICVADTVKEDSAEAISDIAAMGIRTVMLTGDNRATAEAIGRECGVAEVIAEVKPQEKEKIIRDLMESGKVAMVGDGINDAPALTRADTGVAIGAGTDVAIDAADVVLVKSRLTDAAAAVRLSRKTIINIYENLFWAFIYNIICIPLAIGLFGVEMKPMYGALAMSLSSFCVCMNALRLNLANIYGKKKKSGSAGKTGDKTAVLPETGAGLQEISQTYTEGNIMKKTLEVEGMMCMHCEARVKKALEAVPGVKCAAADHEAGTAIAELTEDVPDELLIKAVEDQDYKVKSIR